MQATWMYRARSTDWHYYMPIGVTIALARHLPMTHPLIEYERITHCIRTEEFINDLQGFTYNLNHFYLNSIYYR